MRLLLRYITGDARHPHADVPSDGIRNVLGSLGWLPTDYEFARAKLAEIIERLPETIRDQVAGSSPILITTRPGTWGIVSHETHNRVHIRLLHNDLRTLREEAEEVVSKFPESFKVEFDRDFGFEPEVVIRRFDSEERMVAGRIQQLQRYGFLRYLKEIRRRELLTMSALGLLTLLTMIASIVVFFTEVSRTSEYWRAYLDRGATTFLTAALTLLITMILEYRAWTNLKVGVRWEWS